MLNFYKRNFAIDTVGTNILHYINRSYLCIPAKLNTLRDNKY